jgi:hypothetical protein
MGVGSADSGEYEGHHWRREKGRIDDITGEERRALTESR